MNDFSHQTPEALAKHAWSHLRRASADKRHPLRTVAVATVGDNGPESRMMVMRQFSPIGEVLLFTDTRTAKVKSMQQQPKAALLWWSAKHKLQVRIQANMQMLTEADAQAYLPENDRATKDYRTTLSPGTTVSAADEIKWGTETHFTVLQAKPLKADILQLGQPHQRVQGRYEDDEWQWNWVVP